MKFPPGPSSLMGPEECVEFLEDFLRGDPTDDELCAGALTIGEPIVDWHWRSAGRDLLRIAVRDSRFRKMISCCDFDRSVSPAFVEQLEGLVRPEENIGRAPRPGDGTRT